MKICFIGPADSVHIVKWCKWFSEHGHEIHVISFTAGEIPYATVHLIKLHINTDGNDFGKLKYLFTGRQIRKNLSKIQPDIVNVHYASSYGTAVALSGINNYVLSVWGTDIYDFPKKSFFHKVLLKYSLKEARYLFSTSQAMADEAAKYTNKHFEITPFGVDINLFSPQKRDRKDNDFVIGTVKALSNKYGIDYLLKAAAIIRDIEPEIPLKMRIAGRGPDEKQFRELAVNLGINDIVSWLGFITQEQAAAEWANMDVAIVYSSASESFGVSAVEAQSCACPVIVSDVPGLMEATKPGKTSIVVSRCKEEELAETIIELYKNDEKRKQLGECGRAFVTQSYEMNSCFLQVEAFFQDIKGKFYV